MILLIFLFFMGVLVVGRDSIGFLGRFCFGLIEYSPNEGMTTRLRRISSHLAVIAPLLAMIGFYWPLLAIIGHSCAIIAPLLRHYWPLLAAIGRYWSLLVAIGRCSFWLEPSVVIYLRYPIRTLLPDSCFGESKVLSQQNHNPQTPKWPQGLGGDKMCSSIQQIHHCCYYWASCFHAG